MGSAELQFIAVIVEILIKYGIPGVIKIIADWKSVGETITLADVQELKNKIKRPEDYFKD